MRIAEVIGRVTLSRVHPSIRGARQLMASKDSPVRWFVMGVVD